MWPQGGSAEQDDATGVKQAGGLGHVTLGHVTLWLQLPVALPGWLPWKLFPGPQRHSRQLLGLLSVPTGGRRDQTAWRGVETSRWRYTHFIPSVFPVQALVSLFVIVNIVLYSNQCISTSVPESTTGGRCFLMTGT